MAWWEVFRRLEQAIGNKQHYAFEATLGGSTIVDRLQEVTATHDVMMWFCGLDLPEHHLARVKLRVSQGCHDIPEAEIRERYTSSRLNLIALLSHMSAVQVYDNRVDVAVGRPVATPCSLQMAACRIVSDVTLTTLRNIPVWARTALGAALSLQEGVMPSLT